MLMSIVQEIWAGTVQGNGPSGRACADILQHRRSWDKENQGVPFILQGKIFLYSCETASLVGPDMTALCCGLNGVRDVVLDCCATDSFETLRCGKCSHGQFAVTSCQISRWGRRMLAKGRCERQAKKRILRSPRKAREAHQTRLPSWSLWLFIFAKIPPSSLIVMYLIPSYYIILQSKHSFGNFRCLDQQI
jgi:hypothetical protein